MSAYSAEFRSKLFRHPGPGGWHFATVPKKHAPSHTLGWGRAPVIAEVDGRAWKTSVWRGKGGRTLLAVPKAIRGDKGDGDSVQVRLTYRSL